jgi:hypothetical protein
MKAFGLFVASLVVIVLGAGWVMSLVWTTPEADHAVTVSACVAVVVQLIGFALLRLTARPHRIAAWGLGALIRFLVLGVYALVIVKALGLAAGPALLSLAVFFFLSTLVEPLLLNV